MAWYVGVDLGATNIKAVVSDDSGTVVGRDRRKTPHGPDGDAVTDAVVRTVSAATDAAGVDARDIVACGVGSAGPLDPAAGVVAETPNFGENVERIPLVEPLTSHLDAPVTLHNDAVAALIGERFYAANSPENMVYLTISSGIGAGVAVGGNVLSGWDGNAAEVGHWVVDPDGMTCGCGIDGHWEGYCSGNNIPRHARHIHEESGVPTDLPLEDPRFTAADVFAAAGEDPLADEVLEACNRYNALAVSNIVHAYAPEVISVGGAVAWNNPEQVVAPMRERVPDRVITNAPEIRVTSLGEETVVRGALASVLTANAGIHSVKNG
jgi:glucokinase